jgi:hypothetical protein
MSLTLRKHLKQRHRAGEPCFCCFPFKIREKPDNFNMESNTNIFGSTSPEDLEGLEEALGSATENSVLASVLAEAPPMAATPERVATGELPIFPQRPTLH